MPFAADAGFLTTQPHASLQVSVTPCPETLHVQRSSPQKTTGNAVKPLHLT